ncbi:MAG: capsule assembly Wzi family protein [Candidatus Binataceae bacterium]
MLRCWGRSSKKTRPRRSAFLNMGVTRHSAWLLILIIGGGALQLLIAGSARGSTYVVYIPLDSSIYTELETLNGLGYLDTYLDEIKPISRVEAARLTLEAQANLAESGQRDVLARAMVVSLKEQLQDEIGWLENNSEDSPPTMLHPLERVETQYLYSSGPTRHWLTGPGGPINAQEQTPLLPNNDGLPTSNGSNEIVRMSGWGGFGGFLTGYAEGAVAGPISHSVASASRGQLLGAETVLSLGNTAVSFGQQERSWGTGYFASLSQSDNAKPFWALTMESIHPTYLPWIFRYLGPGRRELFMGQLDADRAQSQHAWIVGHILAYKPLPTLEFGITRAIIFGGRNNDHYNFGGFAGRFTGIATGNPAQGNTKSRAGLFFKFGVPQLRNVEFYQEILGSDNLSYEVPTIGHYMPFLSVAYQGGFYVPRLTADGFTDLRFEYALIPGSYSVQDGNSLYFTYDNQLMGDPLGLNSSEVDVQFGRWFGSRYKADVDFFYTEEAPRMYEGNVNYFFKPNSAFYPYSSLGKEHSAGIAFDVLRIPESTTFANGSLVDGKARIAFEYVDRINYGGGASFRTLVMLSMGITPTWRSLIWR